MVASREEMYGTPDLGRRLGLEHIAPHDLRRTCAKITVENRFIQAFSE